MSDAHVTCNSIARIACGFERFASQVIEDNTYARTNGLRIVDAYTNPNGREHEEISIKVYPTSLRASSVRSAVERVVTLARLSAHVDADDIEAGERVIEAARVALAKIATLDADLWRVFKSSEKQHIEDGREAAELEIDGFAWSASRKGHSTVIRHDETAQNYTRNGKRYCADMGATAYLSERDMR